MIESRTTLARRLVLPVVALVLAAVAANVGFTSWWEVRQESVAAAARQRQVAETLVGSRVAVSGPVLTALHRLTGDHYVVWDAARDAPGLATLPLDSADFTALRRSLATGRAEFGGAVYRVGAVRAGGVRPETVLVLSPSKGLAWATWQRVWPILAVGAATLGALVPLGLRMTRRIAARLGDIDRQVARVAAGDFGTVLAAPASGDEPAEIARLVEGVNRMSGTLASQRDSLLAGERQRLLGQLAAGFAHEVRNAITGARLAIDLHRRRCRGGAPGPDDDGSLQVAVRQLDILEEEVRGLLMLGRPAGARPQECEVAGIVAEAADRVGPRCTHLGVRLTHDCPPQLMVTAHRDPLRSAIANLALNGVEAAGPAGSVRIWAEQRGDEVHVGVDDSGPGPPPAIRESMLQPFVSGKPEGVGLGLAVARAVAESHGGRLEWERREGTTRFVIVLPKAPPMPSVSEKSPVP